tara:strand:- start:28 stop:318 length:291 start_codon:yes stop_codon:yes gene_type:complete
MAVGDIISQTYAISGAFENFQPAAGVEILVTSGIGRITQISFGITNGIQPAYIDFDDNTDTGPRNIGNIKIGITNTYYLYFYGQATGLGFTGIQIK